MDGVGLVVDRKQVDDPLFRSSSSWQCTVHKGPYERLIQWRDCSNDSRGARSSQVYHVVPPKYLCSVMPWFSFCKLWRLISMFGNKFYRMISLSLLERKTRLFYSIDG